MSEVAIRRLFVLKLVLLGLVSLVVTVLIQSVTKNYYLDKALSATNILFLVMLISLYQRRDDLLLGKTTIYGIVKSNILVSFIVVALIFFGRFSHLFLLISILGLAVSFIWNRIQLKQQTTATLPIEPWLVLVVFWLIAIFARWLIDTLRWQLA